MTLNYQWYFGPSASVAVFIVVTMQICFGAQTVPHVLWAHLAVALEGIAERAIIVERSNLRGTGRLQCAI